MHLFTGACSTPDKTRRLANHAQGVPLSSRSKFPSQTVKQSVGSGSELLCPCRCLQSPRLTSENYSPSTHHLMTSHSLLIPVRRPRSRSCFRGLMRQDRQMHSLPSGRFPFAETETNHTVDHELCPIIRFLWVLFSARAFKRRTSRSTFTFVTKAALFEAVNASTTAAP